ncbi:unnamed protein product [Adineta ricciae]|uniref:Uncharacterized protein n=1 Tax=Adineta ricciae TaxID=249248 RepID=A0A816CL94_ADIRI|nr:unnamed protein product [Adineta ricciae]
MDTQKDLCIAPCLPRVLNIVKKNPGLDPVGSKIFTFYGFGSGPGPGPGLKKPSKWDNNLIIHYTYENRLAHYKKDIHQIRNDLFRQTAVTQTRLIVGTRNNPNLAKRLVYQRTCPKRTKRHNEK